MAKKKKRSPRKWRKQGQLATKRARKTIEKLGLDIGTKAAHDRFIHEFLIEAEKFRKR